MNSPEDRTKDVVRGVRLRWGLATAERRGVPDLIVVGAQRAGTTSLFQALRHHPGLLPARFHKGIHYFDINYARGSDWYRAHFATRAHLSRLSDSTGIDPIQFEVTPYYMFHPLAPQRIARDLPGATIVAVLRDPIERAYSAHSHELARGYEDLPFLEAIDREPERLAGEVERIIADPTYVSHPHRHQAYLARGRYVEQLETLEEQVGRDNLLVLDSVDFFADPQKQVAPVLERLGLQADPDLPFEVHNARPRSRMPVAVRERLSAYFEPYDEALARWWGKVPSWRR